MSNDYKVFKGTTLADLFEKIENNSSRNKIQIESLMQEMMVFIKDPNSAIQLFPMIASFMEANIRNDELMVKLTAVVQRVLQTEAKVDVNEFGLSDKEKEDILSKIHSESEKIKNDIDDLTLGIKEI